MARARIAFTVPASWDHTAIALERVLDQGQTRFEVLDRGNGYWHLRSGNVTVHIELRIETSRSTHLWAVGKRKRFDFHIFGNDVDALLRALREDTERQLGIARSAA